MMHITRLAIRNKKGVGEVVGPIYYLSLDSLELSGCDGSVYYVYEVMKELIVKKYRKVNISLQMAHLIKAFNPKMEEKEIDFLLENRENEYWVISEKDIKNLEIMLKTHRNIASVSGMSIDRYLWQLLLTSNNN